MCTGLRALLILALAGAVLASASDGGGLRKGSAKHCARARTLR
jgi:hypothetical protein